MYLNLVFFALLAQPTLHISAECLRHISYLLSRCAAIFIHEFIFMHSFLGKYVTFLSMPAGYGDRLTKYTTRTVKLFEAEQGIRRNMMNGSENNNFPMGIQVCSMYLPAGAFVASEMIDVPDVQMPRLCVLLVNNPRVTMRNLPYLLRCIVAILNSIPLWHRKSNIQTIRRAI